MCPKVGAYNIILSISYYILVLFLFDYLKAKWDEFMSIIISLMLSGLDFLNLK